MTEILKNEEACDAGDHAFFAMPADPQDVPAAEGDFRLIGKRTPRIDGRKIVTGEAKYTHDICLKGMLHGKILRSPHACAEVVSVDLERAREMKGVKAALKLAEGKVKYAGEQVAAVAAVNEEIAAEALKLIDVVYKTLPFVVDEDSAMKENAPRVLDEPNMKKFNESVRGDTEKGLKEADAVIEKTYRTEFQIHHPAETHGNVAVWEGENLTVYDTTQGIFSVRDGLARALGIPYSSKNLDRCYNLGSEKILWLRRRPKPALRGKVKRGMGMASQIWGGVGNPVTQADIKIHRDGSVEVLCGTQDLGTGTRTYMALVAAETLGLKPGAVSVRIGNTLYPWCGGSGGSTTTPSVAPAVRNAALKAVDYLRQLAAQKLETIPEKIVTGDEKFTVQDDPGKSITYAELTGSMRTEQVFHGECGGRPREYAYNTFGAHFAEVEVDTETGQVKVLKVVAVHDSGRIMNLETAESQVIGAVTQGISYALFEQRIMDPQTGTVVNPNLRDYKLTTSMDVPEIVPLFMDIPDPHVNNLGTKGLGEPPMIAIAAAIANAVYNAIGVHVGHLPMTPDRVLEALKGKEGA